MLQRIQKDQTPTGLEYPSAFTHYAAPHFWRQFVEQEDAGNSILAVVGQRDRLGFADNKTDSRPPPQMTVGVPNISIGHIHSDDLQSRPGLLDEVEKSTGATADIEEL